MRPFYYKYRVMGPQTRYAHIYETYFPVLHASNPTTTNANTESPTFHPFPSLPDELRVMIWTYALLNETTFHETRDPNNEYWARNADITIHLEADNILVLSQRKYPTLFFVNRESRAESARIDGGKWYPLGIKNADISVYAHADKDDIWVHDCCAEFLDFQVLPGLAQFELDAGELYVGLRCIEEE